MTVFNRFTSAILLLATATCSFALGAVGRPENSCRSSEFWWQDNQCCLPHGGPPSFPSPPPGNDCPSSGWYWFEEQRCCVPQFPNPPPPSCDSGWVWDSKKCCPPPPPPAPKPSGHGHWKKAQVSRANSLCPFGLDACPVSNSINNDYECLDTTQELESCGGCASIEQGQDCTAIPGVWNVGCESGTCAVYSCAAGYRRASDGRSCVAL